MPAWPLRQPAGQTSPCASAVIEGDQFRRADEGKVERIEEHYGVFALGEPGKSDFLEFVAARHRGGGEVRRGFADENCHESIYLLYWISDGRRVLPTPDSDSSARPADSQRLS